MCRVPSSTVFGFVKDFGFEQGRVVVENHGDLPQDANRRIRDFSLQKINWRRTAGEIKPRTNPPPTFVDGVWRGLSRAWR
ncbi:hypothetical protein AS189_14020 [Arthrobacter alpinus]|uniref:Uncharacterized protein n=1 Tax=Arthrobacter alpinus TaxID=656366 RepID=A0A0S2M1T5_9MICC|nr:hypothetical protein AS189_14020 [Arthrobacter alpinus]